ncbi:glycoside hydrolase family 2 TIM barrel-domain containing protein [Alteromonadaceae bacterium BrNp21-10]|nr:glycoside hydrolase family 2 TIM barrel-domain containing protein [Alteromonadaceae bacterium BrNp21-10]
MKLIKWSAVVFFGLGLTAQAYSAANADLNKKYDWSPSANTMLTRWGEKITPENAWQSYPRPQLQRQQWLNLNGLWQYAVVDRKAAEPQQWQGNILVPFAIESPLSGVGKRLKQQALWYQKEFELSKQPKQKQLLHFEAVDYACKIWLNDVFIGTNQGGNLPFKFDVTKAAKTGKNILTVRVIDDTDAADRYQLRGKQTQNNQGIWYTPVSGIWQTVWLENVAETYIDELRMTANAQGELQINAKLLGDNAALVTLKTDISYQGQLVGSYKNLATKHKLTVANAQLWSPDNPALYDLSISLLNSDGDVLDKISSYIGFRTLAKRQDAEGHWKFTLNGEEVFHWGPLDQGWWPDGLLTPPSDAAIEYEMDFLKSAGFNMIRKHKKVEPRRYYYHADRKGFLIWQDQVSGGADTDGGKQEWPKWQQASQPIDTNIADELEAHWPLWAHQQYMSELRHMIDTLYNHPSIAVWTTFNERWGQHNTLQVGEFVQQYDNTRYLNIASGGNFFPIGDIADAHHYPEPKFLLNEENFNDYIKVVGEFGGHGWPVEGHVWAPDREKMIYGNMPESIDEFRGRYRQSIENLSKLKSQGIAAGVYTQTTDVETEINGLLTYDRKVEKIAVKELKRLHQQAGLSASE